MSEKYFRTPHLPYSPGGTNDDKKLRSDGHFRGAEIVITEKMDGSNVCMTKDAVFARSHNGPPQHPSFDPLKALHATIKQRFCENTAYFGEWCYARHSITYKALPSYFLLFAVRIEDENRWLSWNEVLDLAQYAGFSTVPVLWQGKLTRNLEAIVEDQLRLNPQGKCEAEPELEGIVVRSVVGWEAPSTEHHIAKWVRANHVQTDVHWKRQEIIRNGLL